MPRVICPNCNNKTRNLQYHVCNNIDDAHHRDVAWIGDAMCRLDVIKLLCASGYKSDVSHTLLNACLKAETQNEFLKSTIWYTDQYKSYGKHRLSTYFEYLYYTNMMFRILYLFWISTFIIKLDQEAELNFDEIPNPTFTYFERI